MQLRRRERLSVELRSPCQRVQHHFWILIVLDYSIVQEIGCDVMLILSVFPLELCH